MESDAEGMLQALRKLSQDLARARPGSLDQHLALVAILRALVYLVEADLQRRV